MDRFSGGCLCGNVESWRRDSHTGAGRHALGARQPKPGNRHPATAGGGPAQGLGRPARFASVPRAGVRGFERLGARSSSPAFRAPSRPSRSGQFLNEGVRLSLFLDGERVGSARPHAFALVAFTECPELDPGLNPTTLATPAAGPRAGNRPPDPGRAMPATGCWRPSAECPSAGRRVPTAECRAPSAGRRDPAPRRGQAGEAPCRATACWRSRHR